MHPHTNGQRQRRNTAEGTLLNTAGSSRIETMADLAEVYRELRPSMVQWRTEGIVDYVLDGEVVISDDPLVVKGAPAELLTAHGMGRQLSP